MEREKTLTPLSSLSPILLNPRIEIESVSLAILTLLNAEINCVAEA
jgi:hypothetical protein